MDPERPLLDGSVIETDIDGIAYQSRTFLFVLILNFNIPDAYEKYYILQH